MKGGYVGKILNVNLSDSNMRTESLDLGKATSYIGGKGYAAALLWERTSAQLDPLSPSNILIFATGPLTGTLCPSTRMCIVTKSPLTGCFNDSYAGGRFGHEMKFAGFDFIVISGKAEKPVYLWINDEDVAIVDATFLWGENTLRTDLLIKKRLGNEEICTACIGPAGERLVRYALVNVDADRQAGRGGVGTVMGSKNLKAVAVLGTGNVHVAEFDAFNKIAMDTVKEVVENPLAHDVYMKYGTSRNVNFASDQDIYATRNYQSETFEKADNLSGEKQRENLWIKDHSCYGCPVACSHLGICNRNREYAGTLVEGVDFELTSCLGAYDGIGDLEAVAYANMLCDSLGLDALSTGNVIGWAMECYEKGVLTNGDTEGLKLNFGDSRAQIEVIKKIAYREGIGDLLAEGVKRACERLDEKSCHYAMHVKGMELPAWGIRASPAMGLAYATADRGGCHQRAFPTVYEVVRGRQYLGGTGEATGTPDGKLDRYLWKGKASATKSMQDLNAALWTLIACDIGANFVGTEKYLRMLDLATGVRLNLEQFILVGERIWNLTRAFNVREGIRRKDDTLPPRIFEEPLPSGIAKGQMLKREDFNKMLEEYYQLRGWEVETGIPTEVKLRELDLADVAIKLKTLNR